jgi:hypothetical protein
MTTCHFQTRLICKHLECRVMVKGQQLPEQVALDIEKDLNRTFPEVAK